MLRWSSWFVVLGTFAAACGSGPSDELVVSYEASNADLLNPERGLYLAGRISEAWNFSKMRTNGMTMTYAHVNLPLSGPLPATLLDALDQGLARVRDANLKIIVRFAYNSDAGLPDAPLSTILEHITELTPVLQRNADVIVALEAGFIGEWGEWHDSQNGLDNPQARKTIVEAELAALPPSRSVLLRTPMFKQENWGGPLADGFTGDSASRIGQHNDCFLATDSDYGTYRQPVETWKDFVAEEGRFVPISGGPCKVNPPRSSCPSALDELKRLHFSMLSSRGNDMVWDMWKADGCAAEIARDLGYRLQLTRAELAKRVAPGGVFTLDVDLDNVGYSSPFNARPVYAIVDGNGRRLVAQLADVDPRRWEPGHSSFAATLRVPADLAPGTYTIGLWLPDPDPGLQMRPEYSIQLANTDIWEAETGTNVLSRKLMIDEMAPSTDDAAAIDLVDGP